MFTPLSRLLDTILWLNLIVGLTAWLASASLSAQSYTFQQNDNGQTINNADGSQFTYPSNNLWTQPYSTAEDGMGNTYVNALTNWTTSTSYPDAAGVSVIIPAGASVHLNGSVSFQNLTLGSGAALDIDSSNSGGGGDTFVTVTAAAGGAGTLQNDGTVSLNGGVQVTLALANDLTLTGGGTLQISGPYSGVQGPGTLIQTAGHSIQYTGGNLDASFRNAGTISGTGDFTLGGTTGANSGAISISNGDLSLTTTTLDNTGGTITIADTNSYIELTGLHLIGGTLVGANLAINDVAGVFRSGGATLENVTLAANSAISASGALTIVGTLTNNGYISMDGFSGFILNADSTLAGTGIAYSMYSGVTSSNDVTLTVAAGATYQSGSGQISTSLINNGTVESVYQSLTINDPTFTNNGLLAADNNATVSISSSTNFTNFGSDSAPARRVASGEIKKQDAGGGTLTGGTYTVTDQGNGATLDLGGRSVAVNAAAVTLSGSNANFPALNALADNQGSLALLAQRIFATVGAMSNEGTIALDAGSTLQVNGNFTAGNTAQLKVTVGGPASQGAGSSGVLSASGAVALGGTLAVTLAPGAALPDASESMSFLSAGAGITGSFSNVASGTRIATTDGRGSFLINYGANSNLVNVSGFASAGAATTPAFFNGETALSNGVYYLAFPGGNFFGYYSFLADPAYLFHFDLGFEYVFDAADGQSGVYLYDFASGTFFYTSPAFPFPYLYDFSLNSVLYYYPDPSNPGHYNTNGARYFYDFNTGQIITK